MDVSPLTSSGYGTANIDNEPSSKIPANKPNFRDKSLATVDSYNIQLNRFVATVL